MKTFNTGKEAYNYFETLKTTEVYTAIGHYDLDKYGEKVRFCVLDTLDEDPFQRYEEDGTVYYTLYDYENDDEDAGRRKVWIKEELYIPENKEVYNQKFKEEQIKFYESRIVDYENKIADYKALIEDLKK